MFSPKYLGKLNTVYYSIGSKPLHDWAIECKGNEMQMVQDEDLRSKVLQLISQTLATSYIATPANPKCSLGMRLPFISLLIKNIGRFFSFEITVLDTDNIRRRIRVSNYVKTTKVSTLMCSMPLCLDQGWNHVNLDLAQFTQRTFRTDYVETVRVQVHANCRLRKVYFTDRMYGDDELPADYLLYPKKAARDRKPPAAQERPPAVHRRLSSAASTGTGDPPSSAEYDHGENWYDEYGSGGGGVGGVGGGGGGGGGETAAYEDYRGGEPLPEDVRDGGAWSSERGRSGALRSGTSAGAGRGSRGLSVATEAGRGSRGLSVATEAGSQAVAPQASGVSASATGPVGEPSAADSLVGGRPSADAGL